MFPMWIRHKSCNSLLFPTANDSEIFEKCRENTRFNRNPLWSYFFLYFFGLWKSAKERLMRIIS